MKINDRVAINNIEFKKTTEQSSGNCPTMSATKYC